MFIISPKWIYLNNKKLEKEKALIIDQSVIREVIDKASIEKKYTNLRIIEYSDHVLMPSLTESYINTDDCIGTNHLDIKLNKLLRYGVTRVNLLTDNNNTINYNFDGHLELGQVLELDGKVISQLDINNITSLLDSFKSDPTKSLSISLKNICSFKNEFIKKISSITNELNINLHINLDELKNMTDKKEINDYIEYWEDINLINNCHFHGFSNFSKEWLLCVKRNNSTLMISYKEISDIEKLKYFVSLLEKKFRCVLVSNDCESYQFYKVINLINTVMGNSTNINTINKVIDCVTTNTSNLFSNYLSSGCIKKGNQASFNLFNYKKSHFIENSDINLNICNLDKESLTHVWSSGKKIDIK